MDNSAHACESSYLELADHLPHLVWVTDSTGSVKYFNRRWYEYTGILCGTGLGWDWLKVLHPDDLVRVKDAVEQSGASGEPSQLSLLRRAVGFGWELG